jgi:hypothetical protein
MRQNHHADEWLITGTMNWLCFAHKQPRERAQTAEQELSLSLESAASPASTVGANRDAQLVNQS